MKYIISFAFAFIFCNKIIVARQPIFNAEKKAILFSDTPKCKTFIIFINNTEKDLEVKFYTGKKVKSNFGDEQDEVMLLKIPVGKTKKIRVDDNDAIYKYSYVDWSTYEGNVDVDACTTVEEPIVRDK